MVAYEKGLLTFCILTYRNFDGIFETLDSLFEQDYPKIELIISDDGSPNYDEHIEKIKVYVEKHRGKNIVYTVYNRIMPNKGTVNHVNEVISMAKGEYIKELGADDVLSGKDALSKYVSFLANSEYEICFAKMKGVRPDGTEVYHLESCEDDYDMLRTLTVQQTLNKLFARNFLPAPAWCAKRSLFENHGYYPKVTRLIEDYPYWIHLCRQGVKFGYLDEILIEYRLNGISSAGFYSERFMDDMVQIYDKCIFPYDQRFGILQPVYNWLKKMGLNTYYAKARWENLSIMQKFFCYLKYGPFFVYIWLGNYKFKKLNEKETGKR